MRQRSGVILCLFSLLLYQACTDVIELGSETEGGQLIIYGRITDGLEGHTMEISRSRAGGLPPVVVSGARVEVFDGQGNSGRYAENGVGSYTYDGALIGQPGESYHVRVALADGNVYESRPEVMPAINAIDSLYYVLQDIEEDLGNGIFTTRYVISIFADTKIADPNAAQFYKWNVEESFTFGQAFLPGHNFPWYRRNICYMINELEEQRVLLHNGSELRTTDITGTRVVDRSIDDDFRGVHYFNYIQQSMTESAHEFWLGVDRNANRGGSIFDKPPGVLSTNFYKVGDPEAEVIGYFEAVAVDTARIKITNGIIDQFFITPCVTPPEVGFAPFMCFECIARYYEPECLNCLLIPNSSLIRPSYFD